MSFWRMEDPVLDDSGRVIKGGMWPHQRQWWNSPHYIKALVTGYGGGKTYVGAKRSISLALANALPREACPVMVISPSYKQAKRTVIPTLKSLLNGRRIRHKFNKTDSEFILYRGDRSNLIWVASGDDPEALKGPNLSAAWIDEPFIQDRPVFMQIMARLRHPQAAHRELLLTGTSESLNWGYDIIAGDEREKYDVGLVQASTEENRALPDQYIKSLRDSFDEKLAQAYLDGQFVNLARGLVYYNFRREQHVQELPDDNVTLCIGTDFNVCPMAAVVFWVRGQHMHYVDEIELPNSDTAEMVDEACRRWPNRITAVYPDPTGKARKTAARGKSDFHILHEKGLVIRARNASPARRDRFNAVNVKLHQGALTMSPRCKKLARYMEQYSHELMTKQEYMGHLTDGASYPVEYLFPVTGPTAGQSHVTGLY